MWSNAPRQINSKIDTQCWCDYSLLGKNNIISHFGTLCIVILVGDTGVGKTHLLSRYIKGSLPKNKFPTIGVEFATKPVPLKTGGTVRA